jgi:hypothetical protein
VTPAAANLLSLLRALKRLGPRELDALQGELYDLKEAQPDDDVVATASEVVWRLRH